MKAKISEIFCSLQGEGIYQGEKQIFVRCAKCNLDCAFCDEKNKGVKLHILKEDLIRRIEAMRDFSDTVSITGGEPLLQTNFLKSVLPYLKAKKFRIYLESNGTLPHKLAKLINSLDIIAMDIKLPSSTGLKDFWREHLDFLKLAKKKRVFVKVVITNETKIGELEEAISIVTVVQASIPFVLQPVTPQKQIKRPQEKTLLDFKRRASLNLANVRIIPQFHRMCGVD